jgi:fucose permease
MLILAAILSILVYGIVAATWGTLNSTLGFNDAQNGTIALAQAIGLVIASVSVGPLIDTKGKKTALLLGLGLICASLYALPFTGKDYGLVIICLAVLGFGGGILVTGANALASDVSPSRRGSTLNLLNLFFGLGGLMTPFITANVLRNDAIKMCSVAAVLSTIALIVNAVTPMPRPTGERGFKTSELRLLVGRPVLWVLALFLFLYVACEVGVWNWLTKYLIAQGIDETRARNILSLGFALGLMIGRVVVSRILIKISSATVTLFASILMAITTFVMLQTADPTLAWVAVFCAGMAMAPVFPTTLAMVGDAFPRMTATAMGIVITCGWIGLAVSSSIIGSIADSSSLKAALFILPLFSVAMVIVNLALRPMLRSKAI